MLISEYSQSYRDSGGEATDNTHHTEDETVDGVSLKEAKVLSRYQGGDDRAYREDETDIIKRANKDGKRT